MVRLCMAWWLVVLAVAAPLSARAGFADPNDSQLFSNNLWGTRGAYHLQAARTVTPGTLLVVVGNSFSAANSIFLRGDSNSAYTLQVGALWSPVEGFEVGLRQASVIDRYSDPLPTSLEVQGNPTLLLKWVAPFHNEPYGVASYLTLSTPTSHGGSGLNLGASTLQFSAVGSYRVHPLIDLSANLGYIYDRSSQLFAGEQLSAPTRFAYNVNDVSSRASYGLAALSSFDVQEVVGISPFVELWGEYASSTDLAHNPFAATVGVKAYAAESRIVEGILGADLRLGGQPTANTPGLPPWAVFFQMCLRTNEGLPPKDQILVARCDPSKPCEPGHECEGFACVKIREVVHEKVVAEAAKAPEIVSFAGSVIEAETGEPVSGAEVMVEGQTGALTVDPLTGRFTLWPLIADGNPVKLKARALGYDDTEQVVIRTTAGARQAVTFNMHVAGGQQTGVLRGTVRNSLTGEPIARVSVFIPSASMTVPVLADGSFEASLNVGRHQMLISAPGYDTQKKSVEVKNNQVVILNVDLRVKKSAKAVQDSNKQRTKKK